MSRFFSLSSTNLHTVFLHLQCTLACSLSSSLPLHSTTGEGMNYSERGFLLYDGIHYDPLVLATPTGAVLQTMFPTTQEGVVYEALEIAREAHQVLPNRNTHTNQLYCELYSVCVCVVCVCVCGVCVCVCVCVYMSHSHFFSHISSVSSVYWHNTLHSSLSRVWYTTQRTQRGSRPRLLNRTH